MPLPDDDTEVSNADLVAVLADVPLADEIVDVVGALHVASADYVVSDSDVDDAYLQYLRDVVFDEPGVRSKQ